MISSICSFEIIKVVNPKPRIFLRILDSPADIVAINPNGIKTLLANGVSMFFINGTPGFSSSPTSLMGNSTDFTILRS